MSISLSAEKPKKRPSATNKTDEKNDGYSTAEKSSAPQDPSPGRIIAAPTAFLQKKGSVHFSLSTPIYYLPFFFINVTTGVLKNLEIRATSTMLFMSAWIAGFGIYPKFSLQLCEYLRLGLMIDMGYYQQYTDCKNKEENIYYCRPQFLIGGAPVLITLGTIDYFVNLSMRTLYHRGYGGECYFDPDSDTCDDFLYENLFNISSIGASIKIAKKVKLSFELLYVYWLDFTVIRHSDVDYYGPSHIIVPMLGFKIFGKRFYGDFNLYFIALYGKEHASDPGGWDVIPHPMPTTSFGFIVP